MCDMYNVLHISVCIVQAAGGWWSRMPVPCDLLREAATLHLGKRSLFALSLPCQLVGLMPKTCNVLLHRGIPTVLLHLVLFQFGSCLGILLEVARVVQLKLPALHMDDVRTCSVQKFLRVWYHSKCTVKFPRCFFQPHTPQDLQTFPTNCKRY